MPRRECLLDLGVFLLSFWYSSVIECADKHVHKIHTTNLICWFLLLTVQAYVGHPLSTLMLQVASMPLGLISTQVQPTCHSTHSMKLPFF